MSAGHWRGRWDALAIRSSSAFEAPTAGGRILVVPFAAAGEVIAAASGFAGKILVDATNPIGMTASGLGLTAGFDTSGAEAIAALAPRAKVFKAFNQTGFENMADARRFAVRGSMRPPVRW